MSISWPIRRVRGSSTIYMTVVELKFLFEYYISLIRYLLWRQIGVQTWLIVPFHVHTLIDVELLNDLMVSWLWSRETIWLEAGFTTSTVGPPFRISDPDPDVLCQVLKEKSIKSEFYQAGSGFYFRGRIRFRAISTRISNPVHSGLPINKIYFILHLSFNFLSSGEAKSPSCHKKNTKKRAHNYLKI